MGGEWPKIPLRDLTDKITKGTTPTKSDGGFATDGINFIKAEAVTTQGKIDKSKFAFITEVVHEKYKRSQLEENDILFSMAGVVLGKCALVRKEHLPANTNQALALIRPKRDRIYPLYLHYFLQQPTVFQFVNNSTSQSAQPNINLAEIGALVIKVTTEVEQKAISSILSVLDDKIELNRQTNETLEAMAQALFKSWFVDFDPVIDNALAAGNEIPEPLNARAAARLALGDARKPLPEDILREFPDAFEFRDEMGWLPCGWEISAVYDLATYVNGASFKSDDFTTATDGLPVIKIAEVKNGISGQTKYCGTDKDEKYLIDSREILFSWSGNPETSIDTFVWFHGKGWLNQHVFRVIPDQGKSRTLVYNYLKHLKPTFTATASNKQTTGLGHVSETPYSPNSFPAKSPSPMPSSKSLRHYEKHRPGLDHQHASKVRHKLAREQHLRRGQTQSAGNYLEFPDSSPSGL